MKSLRSALLVSALLPLSAFAQASYSPPAAVEPAPAAATAPVAAAAQPASEVPPQIASLQEEWALIKYKTSNEETQKTAINKLVARAHQVTAELGNAPEAKVWEAIIMSTRAGITGGSGALDDIRVAKDLLDSVVASKPETLQGSAYTSLGSLYYKAPAWPISFGDNKKAESNLKQALAINPDGIDPNFFYGEFLFEQGKAAQAKTVLEHALNAPARPGREVADAGRRDEINVLLAKIASSS
jgi:tetratricopeptide (TPR) repeat protein